MGPARTMTGDTIVSEKEIGGPQSPTSPTSTENSSATLQGDGDAVIDIQEDNSTIRPSSNSFIASSVNDDTAQPQPKKKPTVLRRITGSLKSKPEPRAVTETRIRTLEDTPNGFPRLAAFQSSEANFSLYRSFSYLHSRILLDLQDEITSLEKELDELDWDDSEDDPNRLRSREIDVAKASRDESGTRNRRVVLKELRERLLEYDEVLIKARTLESFQKPSERNYRSVRRYHHNTKPLMDAEMDSVRTKEDIISLRSGREWASFDGGVEGSIGQIDGFLKRVFRLKNPPLLRFFRTPELRAKTSDKNISYYSSTRIDFLINILITFVIFILLVIPVITMYHLTSTSSHGPSTSSSPPSPFQTQFSSADPSNSTGAVDAPADQRDTFNAVGVLVVFTLLFSAAMSMLTRAARHELFAASAAYCAILVVFIGNFTGPGN